MTIEFAPIKIVDIDIEASTQSKTAPALTRVVLKLSDYAPMDWARLFEDDWAGRLSVSKRHVRVFSDELIIECNPDDLKTEHIPEINQSIDEANSKYAAALESDKKKAELEKQRDAAVKARLDQVKKDLGM